MERKVFSKKKSKYGATLVEVWEELYKAKDGVICDKLLHRTW